MAAARQRGREEDYERERTEGADDQEGQVRDQLCTALGISRSAWFRKVGGESEFTQGEIAGLRFELELDDHQTADIFFSQEVS